MLTTVTFLTITALQFPATGLCETGNGWFGGLFNAKGKNMKEVAVKVAELPEQYHIYVSGVDFSLDGKQLAVVSDDEKINIWDWQSGRILHTMNKTLGANDGLVREQVRYSPDGRLFAACHEISGKVVARIWDTGTWVVVHDITDEGWGGCSAIGFTPDGQSLIRVLPRMMKNPGDTIIQYDTNTWLPIWGMRTQPFLPYVFSISPDGKFAAVGGNVINPKSWNHETFPTFGDPPLPNMSLIAIVDLAQRKIVRTIQKTLEFSSGQLAWSPDGTQITAFGHRANDYSIKLQQAIYLSGPDTVMVFDAHTGEQIAGEQYDDFDDTSLRYSPDGKYLIEGSMTGRGNGRGIRIWDGKHRELLQEIPGEVKSLAVSRDGHYFAGGGLGSTTVWKLK